MGRIYKCAPLPFMGQKRYFVRAFSETLAQARGEVDTVVDLFGGSGLLSHTAKRILPECRVIYNDFDGYAGRLAAISRTNALLREIKERLSGVPLNRRLTPGQRAEVLATVERYSREGYVDFMTVGRSVLFSGKWVNTLEQLRTHTMYNRVHEGDYTADGYLDGLEVVGMDYRELFKEHRDNPRALFLLDPPYLTTECGQYENYWRLTDYLDVLRLTMGTRYIYFTSDKSQIVELCRWMRDNVSGDAPLAGSQAHVRTNIINKQARYNDMMITRL